MNRWIGAHGRIRTPDLPIRRPMPAEAPSLPYLVLSQSAGSARRCPATARRAGLDQLDGIIRTTGISAAPRHRDAGPRTPGTSRLCVALRRAARRAEAGHGRNGRTPPHAGWTCGRAALQDARTVRACWREHRFIDGRAGAVFPALLCRCPRAPIRPSRLPRRCSEAAPGRARRDCNGSACELGHRYDPSRGVDAPTPRSDSPEVA